MFFSQIGLNTMAAIFTDNVMTARRKIVTPILDHYSQGRRKTNDISSSLNYGGYLQKTCTAIFPGIWISHGIDQIMLTAGYNCYD